MTYGHLRADCLYTGISSGPSTQYRVWEAFTCTFFKLMNDIVHLCIFTTLKSRYKTAYVHSWANSSAAAVIGTRIDLSRSVATKQSEPKPCWQRNLRSDAGKCVQDTQQLGAVPHWCSGKCSVEHRWYSHWSVEDMAVCMRRGKRPSFWTSYVTNQLFSEACSYTACSFHSWHPRSS